MDKRDSLLLDGVQLTLVLLMQNRPLNFNVNINKDLFERHLLRSQVLR